MQPLVSVDWLAAHVDDPDLRVFDAMVQISRVLHDPDRSRLSKTTPIAGHLEGAVGGLGIGNHAYVESVAPWEETTDDATDDPHSDGHRGSR